MRLVQFTEDDEPYRPIWINPDHVTAVIPLVGGRRTSIEAGSRTYVVTADATDVYHWLTLTHRP